MRNDDLELLEFGFRMAPGGLVWRSGVNHKPEAAADRDPRTTHPQSPAIPEAESEEGFVMEEKILGDRADGKRRHARRIRQLLAAGMPVRTVAHSRNSIEALKRAGTEVFEADFGKPGSMTRGLRWDLQRLSPNHAARSPHGPNGRDARRGGQKGGREADRPALPGWGPMPRPESHWGGGTGRSRRRSRIQASPTRFSGRTPSCRHMRSSSATPSRTKAPSTCRLGSGEVSLIDTRDVAAVAVAAPNTEGARGKAYTITGPEALSNTRVSEILSEVTGRVIRYVDVPDETARQRMKNAQIQEWLIDVLMELYQLHRAGADLGRRFRPSSR